MHRAKVKSMKFTFNVKLYLNIPIMLLKENPIKPGGEAMDFWWSLITIKEKRQVQVLCLQQEG